MSVQYRHLAALTALLAVLFAFTSTATARHNCEEGHFRVENTSISVDPPTSCLNMEVVGEMQGCEHAQLRIDNQCDTFVKMLDDTQAYCDATGEGATECQVIGSGIVGYVDLPWRKVVNTDERQEHRYDVQAENRQTFVFVSFDSTRLDNPDSGDDEGGDNGEDSGVCSTAPLGSPGSALLWVVAVAGGLAGIRRRALNWITHFLRRLR